jgi:hypothetical protein
VNVVWLLARASASPEPEAARQASEGNDAGLLILVAVIGAVSVLAATVADAVVRGLSRRRVSRRTALTALGDAAVDLHGALSTWRDASQAVLNAAAPSVDLVETLGVARTVLDQALFRFDIRRTAVKKKDVRTTGLTWGQYATDYYKGDPKKTFSELQEHRRAFISALGPALRDSD